jgi:hypothetical protein
VHIKENGTGETMMDGEGQPAPTHEMREEEARYQANELAKSDRRLADLLLKLRGEGVSWVEALKELRHH